MVATVIGVYVIQTGLTQVFASELPRAGELAYRIVPVSSEEFMIRTVAFGLATAVSLTWNFVAYKVWVFRER